MLLCYQCVQMVTDQKKPKHLNHDRNLTPKPKHVNGKTEKSKCILRAIKSWHESA